MNTIIQNCPISAIFNLCYFPTIAETYYILIVDCKVNINTLNKNQQYLPTSILGILSHLYFVALGLSPVFKCFYLNRLLFWIGGFCLAVILDLFLLLLDVSPVLSVTLHITISEISTNLYF